MKARRVRVVRVLEYDYPDQETAEKDMGRWQVPANGIRNGWGTRNSTVIRSATTIQQTMPHEVKEEEE